MLKFWLYFSLSIPVIAIIAFTSLFINSADVLLSTNAIYWYIGIIVASMANIIITAFLFNSINKKLKNSMSKIYDWSKKIKSGDLTARLTFSPKSDLYIIAQSYNQMADILEELMCENERELEMLTVKNKELEETNKNLIMALVSTIEAKDAYTLGHSERVAKYASQIATKLNMPADKIEEIRVAGMLHDLGKIGISDSILNKPSKLSTEEFEAVKRHPSIGSWILNNIDLPDTTKEAINYHHERYDGKGYPLGLSGKDLSIEAQIISLSDAYDAMTSDRPYRKAMSHADAIAEIKKCSDTQFNPELVSIIEQTNLTDTNTILN